MYTTIQKLFTKAELETRLLALKKQLTVCDSNWRYAAIMERTHVFYLTGTMQNGVVWIPRDGDAEFWVRRSYDRAVHESDFPSIYPMRSFRDLAKKVHADSIYLETRTLSLDHITLFNKYFGFKHIKSLDSCMDYIRSIKSPTELNYLREAGAIHKHVLEHVLPDLLHVGMSEADLVADVMQQFIRHGHQGICRVQSQGAELFLGQICFGDSALWGNAFDSPGGVRGFSAAVPLAGSRKRTLHKGDIVSVDTGCNVNGYHSDKTVTLCFDGELTSQAASMHQMCLDIESATANLLKPGAIPETIYTKIMATLPTDFRETFMGVPPDQVRFLGHGVGLAIDEWPAIAARFTCPLEENMVISLEPKAWLKGQGMLGIENTYIITATGAEKIT